MRALVAELENKIVTSKEIEIMKQSRVFDGFTIILTLAILIMPFALNYGTEWIILNIALGISLLSNVFITNKKIKIFISVLCVLAILYAYFQMK